MLAELIPERLRKIPELMAVIGAEEPEAQAAYDATVDFLAQLNVDTATWGLDLWEFEYGIQTNISKSLDARRIALKAKMRGAATTTVEQVRRIVNAYTGNDSCVVTEYPDAYMVGVSYTLEHGTREQIQSCRDSLREALPAHVGLIQAVDNPKIQTTLYLGGAFMPAPMTTQLPQYTPPYDTVPAYPGGAVYSAVTIQLPPMEVTS